MRVKNSVKNSAKTFEPWPRLEPGTELIWVEILNWFIAMIMLAKQLQFTFNLGILYTIKKFQWPTFKQESRNERKKERKKEKIERKERKKRKKEEK